MRIIGLKVIHFVSQAVGSQSSTTAASRQRRGFKVNPLDELAQAGMGMLHLCAALGYDWAVSQLLAGGANIEQQVGTPARRPLTWPRLLSKLPELERLPTHGSTSQH